VSNWLVKFARVARAENGQPARLGARQLYIFPTGQGVLYGLVLFAMLMGSLNYSSNLGLLFTFLFTATGLVALLHTWRNLLNLQFSAGDPAPLFAGGEAEFPIRVSEPSGREHPALELNVGQGKSVRVSLPARSETQAQLRLAAVKRGRLQLGRVQIASRYPLGLFRAWAYVEFNATTLVYPKPAKAQAFGMHSRYTRSEQGDRGIGADDFVGPRSYRPGDPPRHLDWKALARERGLVTRQFGGDRAEELWLDWHQLPEWDPEQRLSRLCRMILDAEAGGMSYGLRMPGQEFPPANGEVHKHRCLGALALFENHESDHGVV